MVLMKIYKIENKINHKIYIGQTTTSLKKRIRGHRTQKRTLVYYAFKKYGECNFDIAVIDTANSKKELNEKEKYWIKYYNSITPHGYNRDEGGLGGPKAGWTQDEKVKNEISEKLSYHNNGNSVKVICLNSMKTFKSIREASEYYVDYNLGRPQISEVCRGRKKHIKGFYFLYYDDTMGLEFYREEYEKLKDQREYSVEHRFEKRSKPCICNETQKVYKSCNEAGKDLGVSGTMVSLLCRGKRKSAKGYTFQFIE